MSQNKLDTLQPSVTLEKLSGGWAGIAMPVLQCWGCSRYSVQWENPRSAKDIKAWHTLGTWATHSSDSRGCYSLWWQDIAQGAGRTFRNCPVNRLETDLTFSLLCFPLGRSSPALQEPMCWAGCPPALIWSFKKIITNLPTYGFADLVSKEAAQYVLFRIWNAPLDGFPGSF